MIKNSVARFTRRLDIMIRRSPIIEVSPLIIKLFVVAFFRWICADCHGLFCSVENEEAREENRRTGKKTLNVNFEAAYNYSTHVSAMLSSSGYKTIKKKKPVVCLTVLWHCTRPRTFASIDDWERSRTKKFWIECHVTPCNISIQIPCFIKCISISSE